MHKNDECEIHETEWGEPEICVSTAKCSRRDVILLHTKTDRCIIIPYYADATEEKQKQN
jgi:hypothetical protein